MWGDPNQRGSAQNYCGNNPVNRVDPLGLNDAGWVDGQRAKYWSRVYSELARTMGSGATEADRIRSVKHVLDNMHKPNYPNGAATRAAVGKLMSDMRKNGTLRRFWAEAFEELVGEFKRAGKLCPERTPTFPRGGPLTSGGRAFGYGMGGAITAGAAGVAEGASAAKGGSGGPGSPGKPGAPKGGTSGVKGGTSGIKGGASGIKGGVASAVGSAIGGLLEFGVSWAMFWAYDDVSERATHEVVGLDGKASTTKGMSPSEIRDAYQPLPEDKQKSPPPRTGPN